MTDDSGDRDDRADDERQASDADDPLAWETLDSETAYTCPGFDVVHDEVRLPDGTEADYDYVSEPHAVVVLPFAAADGGDASDESNEDAAADAPTNTDGRRVVVIEEWRQAVGRVNRGLPAGGVEAGDDDLATAARRELAEETGYEADAVSHLVTVEPANGIADSVHHYYVAEGCTPTAAQDLDHDESIRVAETSYEALRAAVLAGEIRDGRAVLGVCYYELSG